MVGPHTATVEDISLNPFFGAFKIEIQHSEGFFPGHDRARIFRQQWVPSGNIRAVLIIVHGLFEHSGRYNGFADYFASRQYAVFSYDHRGHGKSSGLKGYVHHFQDFIADMKLFFDDVIKQYPGRPVFVLGHSIGGTITCAFTPDRQQQISGIILSGAVAKPGTSVTRLSIVMARALSAILPKLGVSPIDSSTISHDQNVVNAYLNDPLVYRGKIRARLGAELINTMERTLPSRYPRISIPALVMHGGDDRLSNIEGSKLIFNSLGSADKTLKIYNGYYHEILNEAGRAQVLKDMEEWLNNHLEKN